MLAGVQATGAAPTAERTDAGMCAGYAMTGGGAARQIVTAHNSRDNVADSVAGQYGTDAQCLAMFLIGGTNADISARARFLQWQTDAFQLEWDERGTTDRRYIYLVIQGGLWRCGELTIDAQTAGAQATVSGLSFKPIGIDTMTVGDNENVSDTGRAVADMVLGSGISPTDRLCLASCALHNQASASVQSRVEYDQIGVIPNVDGTVYTAYDLDMRTRPPSLPLSGTGGSRSVIRGAAPLSRTSGPRPSHRGLPADGAALRTRASAGVKRVESDHL
jgi:hypothetical protein